MKKYEIIFKDLQAKILNQELVGGDYLPPELELTKTYQASRDTVRKALQLLADEGLVSKMQGRGTQVTKKHQINFPVSELTSYQELMQKMKLTSKTRLIGIDKVILDDKLADLTGFAPKSIIWRVTRLRIVDDCPAVIDIDYLDKSLVPQMTKDIAEQSIYAYLENQVGLDIAYAQKEITIDHVTDNDKQLLQLGKDLHVVSVKSQVFLANGRQFQFTESRHKLEKFKFVDLSRRKRLP